MNIKKKRQLLLKASENAIDELIKVLNKKMDPDEIDPEKVKISASAYRLAMEDAISMMNRIEEIDELINGPKEVTTTKSYSGVEGRF